MADDARPGAPVATVPVGPHGGLHLDDVYLEGMTPDGPVVIGNLSVTVDGAGLTVVGPEPGMRRTVGWDHLSTVEFGPPATDPAGRFSTTLEIVVDGLFDYESKYGGHADLRIPAVLDQSDRAALETAAVAMFDALGCAGVARVDFFLTTDGPLLNEVNTMPGFTQHSQVPKMFAAAGMPYAKLLDLLVSDALAAATGPSRKAASGRDQPPASAHQP